MFEDWPYRITGGALKRVRNRNLTLGLVIFCAVRCAGPMTPFGAVPLFEKLNAPELELALKDLQSPHIKFTPERQVLHGPSNFKISLHDPSGIPQKFKIRILFNKLDVSKQFFSQAKQIHSDESHVAFEMKDLRILPGEDSDIKVAYIRDGSQPWIAKYLPPYCSLFENNIVKNTGDYKVSPELLQMINNISALKAMNPSFMAGLIAQESGFNSFAVSTSKAIGLTQITSLGEKEILKNHSEWPRYAGLDLLSPWLIKSMIYIGKINEKNEWRLSPTHAVVGAYTYMDYLNKYWNKKDVDGYLTTLFPDPEIQRMNLILASYNSGPSRIYQSLKKNGIHWKQDPELKEARLYVNRILSYCDHFSDENKGLL